MKTKYSKLLLSLILFIFAYRMKGLKCVDQSISIKTAERTYKIWQAQNSEEFRNELLEQLRLVTSYIVNYFIQKTKSTKVID